MLLVYNLKKISYFFCGEKISYLDITSARMQLGGVNFCFMVVGLFRLSAGEDKLIIILAALRREVCRRSRKDNRHGGRETRWPGGDAAAYSRSVGLRSVG